MAKRKAGISTGKKSWAIAMKKHRWWHIEQVLRVRIEFYSGLACYIPVLNGTDGHFKPMSWRLDCHSTVCHMGKNE